MKNSDIVSNLKLCADQGWPTDLFLNSGEVIQGAYITGTNWEQNVISVERIGERHLPPRVVYLTDLEKAEVIWN